MPAPAKVSDPTERKRQIVAQADRDRDAIQVEFRTVTQRVGDAQDFIQRNRWWLWAGAAVVAGLLLVPKLRRAPRVPAEDPGLLRALRR